MAANKKILNFRLLLHEPLYYPYALSSFP